LNNAQNNVYIAGLDGLRAMAMIFIVAYHFYFRWAGGGFLGVDIFFVLSGYLITCKMLVLQGDESGLSLQKFWSGRISRLLPAAYVMILTTVVWVILFNKELLATLKGDALASVFYSTNWWFIFHKLSYFDSFGTPSPLKHLWFLAVQEQFFFIWTFMLMLGLKSIKNRKKFTGLAFMLALCSALLMGIMYNPEGDPSRIYYGTDTRSFELLIGCWLAMVLPMKRFSPRKISIKQRNRLNTTSIISLAVFILSAIFIDEYNTFLYRGGIFLFSLNTAVLIVCVCHPSSILGHILSCKPLRWIGTRSYGIYLWHYPIMVLSTPVYEIGNPVYWRVILQLTITCISTELTYRFIEEPIRKLGLQGFCRKYLSYSIFKWDRLTLAKRFSAIIAVLAIVVLANGITTIAKNEIIVEKVELYSNNTILSSTKPVFSTKDTGASFPEMNSKISDEKNEVITMERDEAGNSKEKPANIQIKDETSSPPINNNYNKILAIGDSIMMDIGPSLDEKYINITVDGKISRQMVDAVKLAPVYSEFNSTDIAVIIQLGTNGYFTNRQIDSLLDSFSKAHIYLVNTRVPRLWEKKVNKVLKEKADERENVTLVDWYSTAVKHPEYFAGDGVHLMPTGAEALIGLICEAINSK
jgi:peptidoglycan/LPS O-acetylase OafA/YrhL